LRHLKAAILVAASRNDAAGHFREVVEVWPS
jgi:hypothetical protein